ncbi:MAG: M24 family metallopeptidase, partial [Deltaproteobacteria bacterium]|nr:M24 family metallopeptidase [Deltaproteobacteria bacterium]
MTGKSRSAGVGRSGTEDKISRRSRAQVLYADSEKDGNMLYATRVFVPDPFLFFRWRGKKHIAVGDLELARLRREADVDRVFSYRDFAGQGRRQVRGFKSIAEVCSEIFGQLRIRAIEVPHSFPAGLADELRARGLRVKPKPDPFFPEREVKDGKEVARIVHAIRAAEHGMEAAAGALRQARVNKREPSLLFLGVERLTSERLRTIIHQAILEKGCHARNTIVSCAKQSCDPHQRGEGVLSAHEPIIVDIFPRCEVSGYYGDLTRTFVKGEASSRIRGMY